MAELEKVYKGMSDADRAIQKNFETLNTKDTGWVDIPMHLSAAGTGKVRKINGMVYIFAAIIPNNEFGGQADKWVAEVDERFRPEFTIYGVGDGQNPNGYCKYLVYSNGRILTNSAIVATATGNGITNTGAFGGRVYISTFYPAANDKY